MNAREARTLARLREVCVGIDQAEADELNCALIDYIAAVRASELEGQRPLALIEASAPSAAP